MKQHIVRFAKKKSVIGTCLALAVTGTFIGLRQNSQTIITQYQLAAAAKNTVIVSIKGSGQVSGLNQVDIKPTVSGSVLKIQAKPGDLVKAGTPLFQLNTKDALKTIRNAIQSVTDARISVQSAQLSYDKLKAPPDAVTLLQAQNSLNQAQRDLDKLKAGATASELAQAQLDLDNLMQDVKISSDGQNPVLIRNAYDTAVATLKTISQTLYQSLLDSDAILGIDNTGANDGYEKLLSALDANQIVQADSIYPGAKKSVMAFKTQVDSFKNLNQDTASIDNALAQTQTSIDQMDRLLQKISAALLATPTGIGFSTSNLSSLQSTIQSDRNSVASKFTSLLNQNQALIQARTSLTAAQINAQKAQTALDDLKAGADPYDLAAAEEKVASAKQTLTKLQKGTDTIDLTMSANSLAQRRSSLTQALNTLSDAQDALKDYTVKAPFDGQLANVKVQTSDQASPSTVLATLLTQAKIAELSLNEVDATKVKVGQKVTLTFDALPDLSIAGQVSETDLLGTVSQGVVNYAIKILFQTQDDRVKPGMSVTASIVTEMQADVVTVPNSAIYRENGSTVVHTLPDKPSDLTQPITSKTGPTSLSVVVGLANEQLTQIISGLNEGDLIVTRVIDASKTKTAQTTSASSLRIPGMSSGFSGGGARPAGAAIRAD